MKSAISERHSDYAADAGIEAGAIGRAIQEVNVETYNGSRPAVEAKHLVGQIDELPSFDVGQLLASAGTGTLGEIFRAEALV